jgi:hypothetical protein
MKAMLPAYRTRGTEWLQYLETSSRARGAIPTADMLSDGVSVAKCDTKLALNAGAHANPPSPIVFPGFFPRRIPRSL